MEKLCLDKANARAHCIPEEAFEVLVYGYDTDSEEALAWAKKVNDKYPYGFELSTHYVIEDIEWVEFWLIPYVPDTFGATHIIPLTKNYIIEFKINEDNKSVSYKVGNSITVMPIEINSANKAQFRTLAGSILPIWKALIK